MPRLDWETASPLLRSIVVRNQDVFRISGDDTQKQRWKTLVQSWESDPFLPGIALPNTAPDGDGVYRFPGDADFHIALRRTVPAAVTKWFALEPAAPSFNVGSRDFGFAADAPNWVRFIPRFLAEGDSMPASAIRQYVGNPPRGFVRIYAESHLDGEIRRSNIAEIALRQPGMTGFRGSLSENFGLPYVFGCGQLRDDLATGPDLHAGADCANFLIQGLRHEGWNIPWGNPRQFAASLEELPDNELSAALVEEGAFVHLGSHVLAIWEDRRPVGTVDPGDLIVHQLEGLPEIVPLREAMKNHPGFRLMRLRKPAKSITVVLGGNTMLARTVGDAIESRGFDPLERIASTLRTADFSMVNLEYVPCGSPGGSKFRLLAPIAAVRTLAYAGIDAVSLGNNHALDAGPENLLQDRWR